MHEWQSHDYLVFELEVGRGALFGDEQQVVEEEQVPLLALKTDRVLHLGVHQERPVLVRNEGTVLLKKY